MEVKYELLYNEVTGIPVTSLYSNKPIFHYCQHMVFIFNDLLICYEKNNNLDNVKNKIFYLFHNKKFVNELTKYFDYHIVLSSDLNKKLHCSIQLSFKDKSTEVLWLLKNE